MIKKITVEQIVASSFFLTVAVAFAFTLIEPSLSRAIEDQFIITQTVTSEISFSTATNDVTMNASIGGITGGTAYGTTTTVVLTNDNAGYTMTIKASTSPAMQGNTQGDTISDYTPATAGVPDYTFSVPSGEEFGFSVSASTTADLAQKFLDNGSSTCNSSGGSDGGPGTCWMGLSTTATSTIVRSTPTSTSGSTSSIYFITRINSGGFVAEDTYTATATLTATTN